jgi:two-component system, cell cycle response regulator DivK
MSDVAFAPQVNGSKRPEEARNRVAVTGPVLVVEDNESIRELIQIVLRAAGHDVHGVSDAERALEVTRSIRPSLILMDIQLPGMDGLELARRLKGDSATADIIILAVTAYAMESDQCKAREAGCDGYIAKPLDVRTLPETVSAYLDGSFTARDGAGDNGSASR